MNFHALQGYCPGIGEIIIWLLKCKWNNSGSTVTNSAFTDTKQGSFLLWARPPLIGWAHTQFDPYQTKPKHNTISVKFVKDVHNFCHVWYT